MSLDGKHHHICHSCGEIRFQVYEVFDNELLIECENCGTTKKYYSSKDFDTEEG